MLSIRNIVKRYADQTALDRVSMEIGAGSIFGLLGPNGAGKTSLIRIINQITAPDEGEILFKGEKLKPSHIERTGYLPEERGLYKKMEIGEQLIYLARLKGLSRHDALLHTRQWIKKMGMEDWWKKKVEDLSKGMQQKVQFVATVLHNPELIILDEPFSGFDPVNAALIKDEILELNRNGATIIFSTHRMESVEELCDHIALIHKGQKILDGSLKDIRNAYRNNIYKIIVAGPEAGVLQTSPVFDILQTQQINEKTELTIKLCNGKTPNDALSFLIPKVQITELTEVVPGINEIFIQKVQAL